MTPVQRALARHALGLPNKNNRSWRRHYVCGTDAREHVDWLAMVDAGHATRIDGSHLPYGGDDLFHMTAQGAEAALEPGERLDADDFPERAAA